MNQTCHRDDQLIFPIYLQQHCTNSYVKIVKNSNALEDEALISQSASIVLDLSCAAALQLRQLQPVARSAGNNR